MNSRRASLSAAAALTLVVGAAGTASADRAGVAEAVQNAAFQARSTVGYAIEGDDVVYQQARLYTKQYGTIDVMLDDRTELRVAPSSSIVIDEYVYRGEGRPGALGVSLAQGALKFVSGRMPSAAYAVGTPVASIGVRGTEFWLNAVADGRLQIWVLDGTVTAQPTQSNVVFEFEAPAYAVCTATTCDRGDAPPVPASFPLDPTDLGADNDGPGDDGESSGQSPGLE
ncbi:MAG: FecR family protein [Pseudomonadota bacterium]